MPWYLGLPTWLQSPEPVLLRRFVRLSKNDPLVDQVELKEANPTYAHIGYTDGRKSSVSLRDLAPCPRVSEPKEPLQTQPGGEMPGSTIAPTDSKEAKKRVFMF